MKKEDRDYIETYYGLYARPDASDIYDLIDELTDEMAEHKARIRTLDQDIFLLQQYAIERDI